MEKEERHERLQNKLVELRDRPKSYLLSRLDTLRFWVKNNIDCNDSPNPIYRDEIRLIVEEIQRRNAKKTSKGNGELGKGIQ